MILAHPPIDVILGSKVKVTWSQSAKTYWRRSSGRRELCTLSSVECPAYGLSVVQ